MQSVYVHTAVLDAFDGVLCTPASTVADVTRSWDPQDVGQGTVGQPVRPSGGSV
ncbi:hypothetical protein [Streptomyces sp. TE33382]